MSASAQVEVIFGSYGRGDGDDLSDRDILLVDDDRTRLQIRRAELERDGWSVAAYSIGKLTSLASRGALFVQHLKAEGQIVRDERGIFRAITSSFRPRLSYAAELAENARLAALVAVRPTSIRGELWASDLLYVALRNFGIMSLAEKGRYVFAYRDVLNGLADERFLEPAAIPQLMLLRQATKAYREASNLMNLSVSSALTNVCLESLPRSGFPAESIPCSQAELLEEAKACCGHGNAYTRLRNTERAFVAISPTPAICLEDNILGQLQKWIRNPRAYTLIAATQDTSTILYLQNFSSAAAVAQAA